MFTVRSLFAASALATVAACGDSASTGGSPTAVTKEETAQEMQVATITGEVFYRERMLLPPGSTVELQLQDISRADAMAEVLQTVQLTPDSGPPYAFAIEYRPDQIDSRHRYALRATITNGERLLFTSTEYIDPFAGNPVQVMVQRVPEPVTQGDDGALDP